MGIGGCVALEQVWYFYHNCSSRTGPRSIRHWIVDLGRMTWGSKVRLLPKATPELNAMDHLWRHTKRETVGSRATETIAKSALDACQYIIDLSRATAFGRRESSRATSG